MESKRHKIFYGSSPDRGLEMLLYLWPDIKAKFPDAELHFCYGWKLFDQLARTNPERRQWKAGVMTVLQQPDVYDHGRLGKEELAKVRQSCGVWAYPTYFTEINCITALDCQLDGLVPVVINLAALKETVGAGVKIDGDIKDPKIMNLFKEKLFEVMDNRTLWRKESLKGQKFAQKYLWEKIASDWTEEFEKPLTQPKVTVITPTIRTGFWNIMSHNLSIQTYKNFEWLIVDDYPEDRAIVAKEYQKKYGIEIRYLRGGKGRNYSRRCGLCRANNIAWKKAGGELLIWLQDFVLMPANGIESLVDLYRHHPNDLLAPTDIYYNAIEANKENREDWWDGKTKILTSKDWANVRNKNQGVRYTQLATEFELNYGAIPKEVLEKLNGWWEFFDDGLGYDNTEIAKRALKIGSKIIVDDTNVARCINIWPVVGGTAENVINREKILNSPRFEWFVRRMKDGTLPIVRDEKIDEGIKLEFEVPKDVKSEDGPKWINKHTKEIVKGWEAKKT